MFGPQDETTIKLHTAQDGTVWYAKGISAPKSSGLRVDSFLLSPAANGMGLLFRLLGAPQNAELICALYLRYYKGEVRSIELAGPNVVDCRDDLLDPAATIMRMRGATVAAACGGWHKLTLHDYPTYAMLARMLRTNFVYDDTTSAYFNLHPAHKALTFIPTLSNDAAAKMLIDIIDPRWYVDRRNQTAVKKLELFLGLIPAVQQRVSAAKTILHKKRELRCATVLNAWKTMPYSAVDTADPANFLYRIWHANGGGAKGDLRGSQAFLRYLHDNWLAGLESRQGARDGLFAPDLFFKTPAEREAYVAHMAPPAKSA
jgi:hypothetical protein